MLSDTQIFTRVFKSSKYSDWRNEKQEFARDYPDHVPVVVYFDQEGSLPNILKKRVAKSSTIGEFHFKIKKNRNLRPTEATFLLIDNTMPAQHQLIGQLYKQFKSQCGILVVRVMCENTFGGV